MAIMEKEMKAADRGHRDGLISMIAVLLNNACNGR